MTKYFISRVLLLFIASFFIGWALNTEASEQLYNFFGIDFWSIFKTLLSIIILIIGAIVLNLTYTLLYWKEYLLDNFIVEKDEVKNKRFALFRLLVFNYRFSIIQFAFNYEKKREKYLGLLCVLTFLFIYPIFFKGIPFVNNYCAIYGTVEGEDNNGISVTHEIPYIVVPKNRAKQVENEIWLKMPDYVEDVKKKGYVFLQAALIDGFKSHWYDEGFVAYIGCLPYYALEKLIRVLMLFFFPFVIGALVIERINEKNGKNEEKWKTAKAELIRKNRALKDTVKIIQKYQLDKSPHIHNALLSFEKGLFESKTAIILSKMKWIDAQTILFAINNFYTLIPWTESALEKKTHAIIKNNFEMYHFTSTYEKNPPEKAKEYLAELEKEKWYRDCTLKCLLHLIPKTEIEIDSDDFLKLERIENDWNTKI